MMTQDNTGGAAWMREQAAIAIGKFMVTKTDADVEKVCDAEEAICALPLPTDADLLAEAMKLPKVAALVEVAAWIQGQMCEGFCRHLPAKDTYSEDMDFDCAVCRLRSALAPFTAAKETP